MSTVLRCTAKGCHDDAVTRFRDNGRPACSRCAEEWQALHPFLDGRKKCATCGGVVRSAASGPGPAGQCARCWSKAKARFQAVDELADAWEEGERRMEAIGPNGPTGTHYSASTTGQKFDGGKPRWDLLLADMPQALEEVVQVLTTGANKYAARNWAQVEDAQDRYLAANLRHENALQKGEALDPETGRHHLAHKICCDLFRLQLLLEEGEE